MRAEIIRNAVAIGVAAGTYGIAFGTAGIAAGLSVAQTCFLSLVMCTGASQFALVGVIASGGSAPAGVPGALLLGVRNALYGVRLAPLLQVRGWRRLVAAQGVFDEPTAVALLPDRPADGRFGFWATFGILYGLWNTGTIIGALGAGAIGDPAALGLDAMVPAAFLALLAPRLRDGGRTVVTIALVAAGVALLATPLLPAGLPVLLAALAVLLARGDRP